MFITRFAPSPTGHLHLGHAFSALYGFQLSQKHHGQLLLRIEDIDKGRCRPEFETAIYDDLTWLGLDWPKPVRRQSEHMDDYAGALKRLTEMGLLYPCFCTRKQILQQAAESSRAPHGPDGLLYPGSCRDLSDSERQNRMDHCDPYALRLDMARACSRVGALTWHDRQRGEQQARPEMFGDVVLARKDTPTSYHLAVTLDDHLQGVTCVVRGVDLFQASHVHRLLQALLGLDVPEYDHHRLLTDEQGKRFAKRDRSVTLREMRGRGVNPEEVLRLIGVKS
ncbi:MAG: tRNA glutamyl-Q(34) synthetase GluQRS [Magnetococcales bacterium]|nr:tRNA glutamyl-Q(34) synthetase GluQRS [Magnetococcales bacterium]